MKKYIILILLLLITACGTNEPVVPNDDPVIVDEPTTSGVSPTLEETAVPQPTPQPITPVPAEELVTLNPDALFEQIFTNWMQDNPEWATDLGVANNFTVDESQLTNISIAAQNAHYQRDQDHLSLLQALDTNQLTPEQQLSRDILMWELEDRLAEQVFAYHSYTITHLFSDPTRLPDFLGYVHPLNTPEDAQNFVARVGQMGEKFDQFIEISQARADMGMLPPRFAFDKFLGQLRHFANQSPEQSVIYIGFRDRISEVAGLSADERAELEESVLSEMSQTVQPAYARLIDFVDGLRNDATTEDGVWKLPDGDDYYAYALRHHTTTDLSAEEIHQLGLDEVDRIQAEIQALLASQGMNNIGQMYQGAGGINIGSDADREAAIAAYRDAMTLADEKLADVFTLRPTSPLEIVRVPPHNEGPGPGAYYTSPPLDGSRPGVFYVNLANGRFVNNLDIPTLAYHEGIPGHHYQRSIQSELTDVPTFRKASHVTAFAEGWALYAERLTWEYGVYDDNPFGDFGRLQAELFRAARLVVDTGIHHYQWTREEAIQYMMDTLGWPRTAVQGEVERYIVWPGQATAYKVGQLTILRLRDEAQAALGDAFNIAEFHTVVLQNGDIPLAILEQVVDEWVDSQQ